MRRTFTIFALALLSVQPLSAQLKGISLATDLGIQHNFRKGQEFWAEGQTIHLQLHTDRKTAVYFWAAYYSNGKLNSAQNATAKSPFTSPQSIAYNNQALIRFKHISLGARHYLKGDALMEKGWGLYSITGFGVILGRVINNFSTPIDSALYVTALPSGKANFKRLTLDLGLGYEHSLGGTMFLYTDLRCWVPTTDYPSPYIAINSHAPMAAMLNFGVRILFE